VRGHILQSDDVKKQLRRKVRECTAVHGMKDIIEEAKQLPVDDRVTVVDSLLRTLNVPDPEIDKAWAEVAEARLAELRSGRVRPIPGDQVLARIKDRSGR
jgi:putative addiction module component (TIGR02574 family)